MTDAAKITCQSEAPASGSVTANIMRFWPAWNPPQRNDATTPLWIESAPFVDSGTGVPAFRFTEAGVYVVTAYVVSHINIGDDLTRAHMVQITDRLHYEVPPGPDGSLPSGVAAQTDDIYVPTGVEYNGFIEHSMSLVVEADAPDDPSRLWVATEFKQLPSPTDDNFPSGGLFDWLAYGLYVTGIRVAKFDPATHGGAAVGGSVNAGVQKARSVRVGR